MEQTTQPAEVEPEQGFRLGYRPELDGVRALAVVAVMAFHATVGAEGGYLGVEVFFVLSGFLITTLLASEHRSFHGIKLKAFYARRALRLLPALAVMLAFVAIYALVRPNAIEVVGVRRDLLATVFYVSNWSYALRPYFLTSILSHTWTLGVEEQFYVLWPIVLVVVLRRRRGLELALAVAAFGAIASTGLRAVLYETGVALPRVSWGLDTRVGALLLGSALALALVSGRLVIDRVVAGVLGLAGFVWLLFIFWSQRYGIVAIAHDPGREFLDGIMAADIASAFLLVGLVCGGPGLLRRAFSTAPVVWIGKLSYGLYLWHLPIDLILLPERTGLPNGLNQVLRLGVTIVVVLLSYRFVEKPALRRKARWERRPDLAVPAELRNAPA